MDIFLTLMYNSQYIISIIYALCVFHRYKGLSQLINHWGTEAKQPQIDEHELIYEAANQSSLQGSNNSYQK